VFVWGVLHVYQAAENTPGSSCTVPRREQARYFHLLTTKILLGVNACVCEMFFREVKGGEDMSLLALQQIGNTSSFFVFQIQ